MMKFLTKIIALMLALISLFSCEKEPLTVQPSSKVNVDVFDHLSMVKEEVTFLGFSEDFAGQSFSGRFTLNEEKSLARGELFVNGLKRQDFEVTVDPEYLRGIQVRQADQQTFVYENVLEGTATTLTGLRTDGRKKTGRLHTPSLTMDFTLTELPGVEGRILPVGAWGIVAGVSTLTTVGTCAYERSAARNACQEVYADCNVKCGDTCVYHYENGICGGACEVKSP